MKGVEGGVGSAGGDVDSAVVDAEVDVDGSISGLNGHGVTLVVRLSGPRRGQVYVSAQRRAIHMLRGRFGGRVDTHNISLVELMICNQRLLYVHISYT
jgi:hypothetical protein